jgi:hypothetical protein
MRLDFPRGYFVSDEKKLPPLESTSSLSSSGLPPADRSLERVLGAVAAAIEGCSTVARMIHQVTKAIHDEVTSQGKLSMARHEMVFKMLGKMRVELATLTDQLNSVVTSNNIQLGATITARDALVRTREKIEEAAKDITDSHELMRAEDAAGDAPKAVRVFVVKVTNFMWPVAVRGGKAAAIWGVKLVGGFTALGGIAKILHDLLAGL